MTSRQRDLTMIARLLACSFGLGLVLASIPATAGPLAPRQTPPGQHTAEEASAPGKTADRRAQAQEHRWDRRLNEISASICNGC